MYCKQCCKSLNTDLEHMAGICLSCIDNEENIILRHKIEQIEQQLKEAEKIIRLCRIDELDIYHAPKKILVIDAIELSEAAKDYLIKYSFPK